MCKSPVVKVLLFLAFVIPLGAVPAAENLGEGIFVTRSFRSDAKKKIAIATVIVSGKNQENNEGYSGKTYAEVVSFGTKSKRMYARRHGYDFIVATQKLSTCFGISNARPLECAWTKLALVSRVLRDYDWVFWTDADSVILNLDTDLEEFIDEKYDIIAATENPKCKGKSEFLDYNINTGQVFFKNSDFSKFVIQEAWKDQKEVTPGFFEQRRINKLLHSLSEQEKAKVLVYPASPFNVSPDAYQSGDFIMHMFTYHGKELYEKFIEIEKEFSYILGGERRKQNG